MRLLALDTASGLCSVALWVDGEVRTLEHVTAREHATLLLPMVGNLLSAAQLRMSDLDAIAFGRGPGSFTGLRVAASVAQGLALGAGIPVLPVSDLRALALQARSRAEEAGIDAAVARIACCMDARMGEVYAGTFEAGAGGLPGDVAEQVLPPDAYRPGAIDLAIGKGFDAYAEALAEVTLRARAVFAEAEPRAREIAVLASGDFAAGLARDAADALPTYLRDNVARPSP